MFKPQLLPNNKAGEAIDWEKRIGNPQDWLYSNKLDGARIELYYTGTVKGRSLKDIPSIHIQQMGKDIIASMPSILSDTVIECEFFSPEMNFAEIMHFFRCEDVTSVKEEIKLQKLWNKTKGGTVGILNKVAYPIDQLVGHDLQNATKWDFPGRTVKWLTTWHKSLKFYAFDCINVQLPLTVKLNRSLILEGYVREHIIGYQGMQKDLMMINQVSFDHIDNMYQAYDQAMLDGYEGLVLIHKNSSYKFGRHTINANVAFKIKDDNKEYDGLIIAVEEGTIAIEGSEKKINELGRSTTSKLKEDRTPSGMAKGLKVKMDDGKTLTVSLKNFSHPDRIYMLREPLKWIGESIRFTGMAPVKKGGVPRHAHFTKGDFRDAK